MTASAHPAAPAHQPERCRFVLSEGAAEAVLDYRREDKAVVFTHTFVPPELRGGGRAARLVEYGLEWAAQQGLEVRAECTYVAAVLARKQGLSSAK
jgi:predicted GNAT family acetyltransferase